MSLSVADQYYLKGLDHYNYDWEEVVENVNYALSADPEHAGANHLMGKLHYEQLKNFDLAESYFVSALESNPCHIDTCFDYTLLLMQLNRFEEASNLLTHLERIPGAEKCRVKGIRGQIAEQKGDFNQAKLYYQSSKQSVLDPNQSALLKQAIERVDDKLNAQLSVRYEY
jgi:Tfp pilus assembly protein PilF